MQHPRAIRPSLEPSREPRPAPEASLAGAPEVELVAAAASDPDAVAALYRRHAPAIQRYLRRRLGDRHLVEDALAETFLSALRGISRFQSRGVPFRAWLYRLAESSVNRSRRRSALAALEPLEREPSAPADDSEARKFEADEARAALLSIGHRHQSALALHYLEGLSVRELSEALGIRPGTVKSRLARGRIALRAELERRGWKS